MRVESVRRLLTSGEITACASDHDFVDSLSVEVFHCAERERIGKVLQEMVREAEDMASTTSNRFPSGADPKGFATAALSARRPGLPQVREKRVEFLVRLEDVGRPLLGRLHRLHALGRGKVLDRHYTS